MDEEPAKGGTQADLRFRQVADQWSLPLMALDRDLRFVYANHAYMETTNTDWATLKHQFIFDVFPDVPERRDPVEAKFRRVFAGEQTRLDAQPYELKMPDGSISTRVWQTIQDPLCDETGRVTHMIQRAEDITAQMELKRQNEFMESELAHRIRNMFAVIMATSRISGAVAEDTKTFIHDFNDRLASMSRVYTKLTENDWRGLDLRQVMQDELDAVTRRSRHRYTLEGRSVILTVKASKDAAMIIHELAANARKYGAFRYPNGHVTVKWEVSDQVLTAVWTESGVGVVPEPERKGFGTMLFDMFPKMTVGREFRPGGVQVTIRVPLLKSPIDPPVS